jgi:hypothetical protein
MSDKFEKFGEIDLAVTVLAALVDHGQHLPDLLQGVTKAEPDHRVLEFFKADLTRAVTI